MIQMLMKQQCPGILEYAEESGARNAVIFLKVRIV
jgi:hypothetical protein